jgi:hypothetical protein
VITAFSTDSDAVGYRVTKMIAAFSADTDGSGLHGKITLRAGKGPGSIGAVAALDVSFPRGKE